MKQEVPVAILESFCDGSQDFLRFPILMANFTEMDHVQNVETLCQRLDIFSDHSFDNIMYNSRENKITRI